MATDKEVRNTEITPARLWFGLASSAIAWASLGFVDILITWKACVHQEQFGNASYHPAANWLYITAELALFAIVVAGGILSYLNWRALSSHNQILHTTATDRREFMALLGVFVSITLGTGVVWLSIPPLILQLSLRAK